MSTLAKFGVPLGGDSGRGGILQPKPKWKFRVRFINFGPVAGGMDLTLNVKSCGIPKFSQDPQEVHSYNSIAYYGGKGKWESISLTVRDDVTNTVAKLVGHQQQKQHNFKEHTSPLAGSNYKFQMIIETMDGGNDTVLEAWELEGCQLTSIDRGEMAYEDEAPREITMDIRYDAATQNGTLMPVIPQLLPGVMI